MAVAILGIDPGLQVCGYGCVRAGADRDELIEAGFLQTDGKSAIEARLKQIADDIASLLERFRPGIVAVEKLYSHYAHPRTAILMGHARGVILYECARSNIEVMSFSATRIKKSVSGNGQASKQQIQRSVQSLFSLAEPPTTSDVADAIAVAACCSNAIKSGVVL